MNGIRPNTNSKGNCSHVAEPGKTHHRKQPLQHRHKQSRAPQGQSCTRTMLKTAMTRHGERNKNASYAVSLYQLLPRSIGSTTHQNEKGKRLSTKREGVHGYIPCVCDTLSSRTAPKESSFDHCVPLFAISSKLVPVLRVNVESRHSFFHCSAIGHLCGTCASWCGEP